VKLLHRPNLYCWSGFDLPRNIDFNGYLLVRPEGNVAVDPMPLSEHDLAHLQALGGCSTILLTNSDHVRGSLALQAATGARIAGPRQEAGAFPFALDLQLGDGDELGPGLQLIELAGSKTPGELALHLDGHTLLLGDLVRCHGAGRLHRLPLEKLKDPALARQSVARLAALAPEAVLVGDGWPLFSGGQAALQRLVDEPWA
jgi:hypothetical protein